MIGGWDPGSKGDGGEILNDVWRLDLSTWTWTEANVQVRRSSYIDSQALHKAIHVMVRFVMPARLQALILNDCLW